MATLAARQHRHRHGRRLRLPRIDVDLPKAEPSLRRLEQLGKELPETRTARTGGGGLHLYFLHPERTLPNTTGRLPGLAETLEGIDVRAHGGYVVAPPSRHISSGKYLWIDANQAPAELPAWIEEPERPPKTLTAAGEADFEGDGSAYGLAVLTGELDQLRTATPGTRNHALNRSAFAVGQVVAGGELDERHARSELLSAALAIGLPDPKPARPSTAASPPAPANRARPPIESVEALPTTSSRLRPGGC